MQLMVKLLLKSLHGEQISKDIEESFTFKSEYWLISEYDERVRGFWKISHGSYVVKMIDDKVLEEEVKKLKTMPLHLSSFLLSNSKRKMNNFNHAIGGFQTNDVYYGDTDNL